MRVFEGLAAGAVLLTDRIGNGLSELVTDRAHVVMYDLTDADDRGAPRCDGPAAVLVER